MPHLAFNKMVLASNNKGKLAEFQHLFEQAKLSVCVLPQSDFHVPDAEETGLSFVENAILKARHASKLTGLPALADDSGLAVPVLGGMPGIYSARYASLSGLGEHGNDTTNTDTANNAKLLDDLKPHRNGAAITAYFVCVLALVTHEHDPLPMIAQGLWHGEILPATQGENGFGYDPLFWLPALQKTSAELTKSEKSSISHRAIAMKNLVNQLTGT